MLYLEDSSDVESVSGIGKKHRHSATSSMTSRTITSVVGYTPVAQWMIDQECTHLTNWLNNCVLTNQIGKFPEDFIASGGQLIFELIQNLSGKKQSSIMQSDNKKQLPTDT